MGYFSNGTEGELYEEEFCSKCVHDGNCAVWDAHMEHNYAECNMLIPRGEGGLHNERCSMFIEKKKAD